MSIITLSYNPRNEKLAAQIHADLEANGHTISQNIQPGGLTIVILSPDAIADSHVRQTIIAALDANQHIIPVLNAPVQIPRLIENLPLLDFSTGYDSGALQARIAELTTPGAPPPLVALTPSKQKANRQAAVFIGGAALVMFVLALLGVLSGAFVPPADEFAGVETQIFLTRNYFIDQSLPRSTEDAQNFPATVERARETIQPFLILTATGIAGNSESVFYPRSTDDATAFPATLARVSTLVQERMAAAVTELAMTNEAIVPSEAITPTPDN